MISGRNSCQIVVVRQSSFYIAKNRYIGCKRYMKKITSALHPTFTAPGCLDLAQCWFGCLPFRRSQCTVAKCFLYAQSFLFSIGTEGSPIRCSLEEDGSWQISENFTAALLRYLSCSLESSVDAYLVDEVPLLLRGAASASPVRRRRWYEDLAGQTCHKKTTTIFNDEQLRVASA